MPLIAQAEYLLHHLLQIKTYTKMCLTFQQSNLNSNTKLNGCILTTGKKLYGYISYIVELHLPSHH